MNQIGPIVILTGAGISAESGLQTFRADDGLWCEHRIEEVATPEAFARNPALVHEFYNTRRRQLCQVRPNPAHLALAKLAKHWPEDVLIVTQNVDDLHDRALEEMGCDVASCLIHMHGELLKARHIDTGEVITWTQDLSPDNPWRPHIVWFGEMPLEMERIYQALNECDLFISIGTSGNVYPAAGFVMEVARAGAETVELNLEPTAGATMFSKQQYGNAGRIVPAYVEELLSLL